MSDSDTDKRVARLLKEVSAWRDRYDTVLHGNRTLQEKIKSAEAQVRRLQVLNNGHKRDKRELREEIRRYKKLLQETRDEAKAAAGRVIALERKRAKVLF